MECKGPGVGKAGLGLDVRERECGGGTADRWAETRVHGALWGMERSLELL